MPNNLDVTQKIIIATPSVRNNGIYQEGKKKPCTSYQMSHSFTYTT